MSTCGLPDDQPGGGPMRTAIPMTDMVTGLYATIGILGALMHRQKTGEGQAIDAAMLDATVAFNGHLAVGYLMSGKAPQRVGNTNPIASPSEVFDCADGLIIIAAGNNGQFQQLCAVLGAPDMPADPRFATNMQRITHRSELRGALQALVRGRSRAQLLQQLSDATVPAGPINNMAQVFADPQTQHRQMVVELPHSSGQTVRVVRSPLNFSAAPVTHRAPPRLGEHSLQTLREELGLTDAQVAGLVARGVV
jgi:crotonobetainyl-CoA:carnitine CoA-transferase CaiB-like acyl-CoA transferase